MQGRNMRAGLGSPCVRGSPRLTRLSLRRLIEPRLDAPFPLWMIFPVIFVALYASHFSLLRLPYYWDEAGYYIPAAWDFFRTGSLIPTTTLTNAHPPLPSVYLALWWKASGYLPEVTREAVLIVASLGLLAVWRLALRLHGSLAVAFWTVMLTGLYPIWFAQSTLAQADIFAAAFSLVGPGVFAAGDAPASRGRRRCGLPPRGYRRRPRLRFRLRWRWCALCRRSERSGGRGETVARSRLAGSCVVPLAAWYGWHYFKTGLVFGNPEFLRYNAQATLAPERVLAALVHRVLHLTGAHEHVCAGVADAGGHDAAAAR